MHVLDRGRVEASNGRGTQCSRRQLRPVGFRGIQCISSSSHLEQFHHLYPRFPQALQLHIPRDPYASPSLNARLSRGVHSRPCTSARKKATVVAHKIFPFSFLPKSFPTMMVINARDLDPALRNADSNDVIANKALHGRGRCGAKAYKLMPKTLCWCNSSSAHLTPSRPNWYCWKHACSMLCMQT